MVIPAIKQTVAQRVIKVIRVDSWHYINFNLMAPGCCKYVLDATLCCISPSVAPQTLRWKHPSAFQAALHFLKQTTRHSRSTAGSAGHEKHFALVQPSLAANISPWHGKNPSSFLPKSTSSVSAFFGEAPNMAAALGETFGAGTAGGWSPAAERKSDFTKRKAMTWGSRTIKTHLRLASRGTWFCLVHCLV